MIWTISRSVGPIEQVVFSPSPYHALCGLSAAKSIAPMGIRTSPMKTSPPRELQEFHNVILQWINKTLDEYTITL